MICVGGYGRKEFAVLMSKSIPDLNFYGFGHNNPFPSTPTTRMGGTAGRTSPIGRWHNSGSITETRRLPSGTSSIMSTVYSITPIIGSGIRRTSSGICRACLMPRTFGSLPKRGSGWGRSTSAMRMWRISAPFRRDTGYTARLACGEDEVVQGQNGYKIQRFPDA